MAQAIRSITQFTINILTVCVISCVFASVTAARDAEEPAPADTVFTEIRLDAGKVTAVDTAGQEWYYDFQKNSFLPGEYPNVERQIDETGGEGGSDDIPVEERCTEPATVTTSARTVLIGYDEYYDGDINALGRVTVKGWVRGNVRSFRKRVIVTESGRVDGNIEAPEVIVKYGGEVGGEIIETGDPIDLEDFGVEFSPSGVIVVASFIAFLLVATFLILSLMPLPMSRFSTCIRNYKARCYLFGFLLIVFMAVPLFLVAITIVGLLLLPLVPLAYFAAMVMGVITFGRRIGDGLGRIVGQQFAEMFSSLVGMLIFMGGWMVVAVLMGSSMPVAYGFGIATLVIMILISTFPVCTGVGAAVLTRFGFRDYAKKPKSVRETDERAGMPAPPPLPKSPDINSQGT